MKSTVGLLDSSFYLRLCLFRNYSSNVTVIGDKKMARGPFIGYAFYSINEIHKPAGNRVYHNNSACPPGRDIPEAERRPGTGGYRLCHDCEKLNTRG
jgi:hypothetical protein